MKRINLKKNNSLVSAIAVSLLVVSSANAATTILFTNNSSPFDGNVGIGTSQEFTDPDTNVTFNLQTVDIIGEDGLRASNGAGHTTNVRSNSKLAINGTNFEVNEAWEFSFDTEIEFDTIDLSSYSSGQTGRLTFLDGTNAGAGEAFDITSGSPTAIDYSVAADTTIRLQFVSNTSTTDDTFQLDHMVVTAVPEPSSTALLGAGFALFALRRRR